MAGNHHAYVYEHTVYLKKYHPYVSYTNHTPIIEPLDVSPERPEVNPVQEPLQTVPERPEAEIRRDPLRDPVGPR